ncbi:hypothetical protein H8959_002202 [Pygathrix nigripes]
MATNFSIHEKIWFDKLKYNDAERRFSKQMNEPVASTSRQENGASVILCDTARARENIQKSLAGNSGLRASSGPSGEHSELVVQIASLEVENQSLCCVVQELQQTMSKLEAWLNVLEKSSVGHQATVPQTQHLSPMCQVEPRPRSQSHQQRMTRMMMLTFLAATMRRRTRRQRSCRRNGCGTMQRRRPRSPWLWPTPPSCWTLSLGTMRGTRPSWKPVCASSSWKGWSVGPPSWCLWATHPPPNNLHLATSFNPKQGLDPLYGLHCMGEVSGSDVPHQ